MLWVQGEDRSSVWVVRLGQVFVVVLAGMGGVGLAFLKDRARAFCVSCPGPLLYSGQGDCTPTVVRHAARCTVGGKLVHRSGAAGVELMVQRGYVYGFDDGEARCVPVWVPPLATPSTSAWIILRG